jgi:hypothetical protein
MQTAKKMGLRFAVIAGVLSAPLVASAQPAPTPGATPANSENVQATVRNENGRRVYVASTVIDVRGEIQRPYAFSVSGRSSLGYSYFEQPVHFVQEILESVRRAPFKP